MSTKTKLWKLLLWPAVCLPSLIVHQNCSVLATAHDCETELLSHNDYDKHLKRFKTLKQRMLATILQTFSKKISFQIANMGENANCTPDIHYQLG